MNQERNSKREGGTTLPKSLRLPVDLDAWVREEAARQGRSVSNMIVFMIECYRRDKDSE